ncbi:hypothetical protein [Geodermatophilus sp. URMC 63]
MTALAAVEGANASMLQLVGAGLFGVVLGWFVYFVNRHRRDEVALTDIGSLIAAVGAGGVLSLFPAGTDLFGAYGIGLAVGFFSYLIVLVVLVRRTPDWSMAWFLDGRRPALRDAEMAGDGDRPMGGQDSQGSNIR